MEVIRSCGDETQAVRGTLFISLFDPPDSQRILSSFRVLPLYSSSCSLRTLFVSKPTAIGPEMVQSMMAQVTIKNNSDDPSAPADEKIPRLSATAEMRKPISPRATIRAT